MSEYLTDTLIERLRAKQFVFLGNFPNEAGVEVMVWTYPKSCNVEPYFFIPVSGKRVSPKIFNHVWQQTENL